PVWFDSIGAPFFLGFLIRGTRPHRLISHACCAFGWVAGSGPAMTDERAVSAPRPGAGASGRPPLPRSGPGTFAGPPSHEGEGALIAGAVGARGRGSVAGPALGSWGRSPGND